ncbi:MAG: hypothetical protein AB7O91_00585 [Sphingomonas sp.]
MSILASASTKIIAQGMSGDIRIFRAQQALAYGPRMVGGARSGEGGRPF